VYSTTGTALTAYALVIWMPRSQNASVTIDLTDPAP
jgi:hypothetical protein